MAAPTYRRLEKVSKEEKRAAIGGAFRVREKEHTLSLLKA